MIVEEGLGSRNVFWDGAVHGMRGIVVGLMRGGGVGGWLADGVGSCWYRAATAGVSSTYSNDTSAYMVSVYYCSCRVSTHLMWLDCVASVLPRHARIQRSCC